MGIFFEKSRAFVTTAGPVWEGFFFKGGSDAAARADGAQAPPVWDSERGQKSFFSWRHLLQFLPKLSYFNDKNDFM
ncbi:MAG: hypothetical protein PHX69_13860 [Simplicispira sp.]|uniref:hypothetical protein n=1 Tax=Simplicispira sp. TaxID=2015802 RepID=UPI00258C3775|nr:hypothetical protein [Simplicispira sp.]MDD2692847.1 hypothetical protein [Simplicispira sp.]